MAFPIKRFKSISQTKGIWPVYKCEATRTGMIVDSEQEVFLALEEYPNKSNNGVGGPVLIISDEHGVFAEPEIDPCFLGFAYQPLKPTDGDLVLFYKQKFGGYDKLPKAKAD